MSLTGLCAPPEPEDPAELLHPAARAVITASAVTAVALRCLLIALAPLSLAA
jgi:hypothetical protein